MPPAGPPLTTSVEPATALNSASDHDLETIPGLLGLVASFEDWNDSETTVNGTPSHYPGSFSSGSFQTMVSSSCEVYVEKMVLLQLGYPLWSPQPDLGVCEKHRRRGVSPGDIGIITPEGSFDFLFNILHTAQHPLNPNDLPEDFVSLSLPDDDILRLPLFDEEAHLSNMVVQQKFDESTGDISYDCKSNDKGALLSMPHGAVEKSFKSMLDVQEFVHRYCSRWYKYAVNIGRDVDRHSLCVVTSCIKSDSWGILTFDQEVKERKGFTVIGKRQIRNEKLPSMKWKKRGDASSYRTGPGRDGLPDSLENQCLFFSAYHISLAQKEWDEIWEQRTSAVMNENGKRPSSLGDPDSSRASKKSRRNNDEPGEQASTHTNIECNVEISEIASKNILFHPLKEVNEWLLSQVPDARAAITHDSDWFAGCKDGHFDAEHLLETVKEQYIAGYCKDTKTCTLKPREEIKSSYCRR
ncbi:hypothetical protein BDQ17DRAFT_845509 [Cyathus striatus]|nr:hypothetical protein BDQ17DRAFT_845509 [Cyathus striatus]